MKSFFYLAYPVAFKTGISAKRTHHLTLKFLGDQLSGKMIQEIINRTLAAHEDLAPPDAASLVFQPEIFDTPEKEPVRVLEAVSYPWRLSTLHNAFDDIRKDDYTPWRPHVTFEPNPNFWETLLQRKIFSGADLEMDISELVLFHGKLEIYTFMPPSKELH